MTTVETRLRDRARAAILHECGLWLVTKDHASWKLPGGKLEEHEGSFHAVIREVREELDCEVMWGQTLGRYSDPRSENPTQVFTVAVKGEPKASMEIVEARPFLNFKGVKLDCVALASIAELRKLRLLPAA